MASIHNPYPQMKALSSPDEDENSVRKAASLGAQGLDLLDQMSNTKGNGLTAPQVPILDETSRVNGIFNRLNRIDATESLNQMSNARGSGGLAAPQVPALDQANRAGSIWENKRNATESLNQMSGAPGTAVEQGGLTTRDVLNRMIMKAGVSDKRTSMGLINEMQGGAFTKQQGLNLNQMAADQKPRYSDIDANFKKSADIIAELKAQGHTVPKISAAEGLKPPGFPEGGGIYTKEDLAQLSPAGRAIAGDTDRRIKEAGGLKSYNEKQAAQIEANKPTDEQRKKNLVDGLIEHKGFNRGNYSPAQLTEMGFDEINRRERLAGFSDAALSILGNQTTARMTGKQLDALNAAGQMFIKSDSERSQKTALNKVASVAAEIAGFDKEKAGKALRGEFDAKVGEAMHKGMVGRYKQWVTDAQAGDPEAMKNIRENEDSFIKSVSVFNSLGTVGGFQERSLMSGHLQRIADVFVKDNVAVAKELAELKPDSKEYLALIGRREANNDSIEKYTNLSREALAPPSAKGLRPYVGKKAKADSAPTPAEAEKKADIVRREAADRVESKATLSKSINGRAPTGGRTKNTLYMDLWKDHREKFTTLDAFKGWAKDQVDADIKSTKAEMVPLIEARNKKYAADRTANAEEKKLKEIRRRLKELESAEMEPPVLAPGTEPHRWLNPETYRSSKHTKKKT